MRKLYFFLCKKVFLLFMLFITCTIYSQNFTNGAGNNDFYNDANWSTGTFPTASQHATINTSGSNKAILNTFDDKVPKSLRVGLAGNGELEIQKDGFLRITSPQGTSYVGHNSGSVGLINQNGGSVTIGAGLNIGTNNGTGTWNLNSGLLKSTRGSVAIGGGNGMLNIAGGEFQTRTGVDINNGGNFKVTGSDAHYISIGSNGSVDGYWNQAYGGKVSFEIDTWGATPIEIKYVDGAGTVGKQGDVTFSNGSFLEVGFANGVAISGTWTVMKWDGTLTNFGLAFSNEVDPYIWSFAFVGKSLQVTANVSNTTTSNNVPHTWYDTYFTGLSSNTDYEALDNLDSDGDGLINALEFKAKTDPKDNGVVASISELIKYTAYDGVNIKMTPGDYTVTKEDIYNNEYVCRPEKYGNYPFLNFSGSNSTYDLSGVKINFSAYYYAYEGNTGGSDSFNSIHVRGNNNTVKGLNWEENDDNYSMVSSAVSFLIDGNDNLIESITFTTRGSYPYGYGSYFGIGSTYTIAHKKHSGMLIRGDNNHILGVTQYSRTFGHALFMQGAKNTTIENCYIEGELRTTDDMLTETSGPAYDIDFLTTDDSKLEAGHMSSLSEDGIRAYATGFNYETGGTSTTSGITVKNCVVKNMRRAVHTRFSTGNNTVTGCTAIGIQETGFMPGNGDVYKYCSGDAVYCPITFMYYSTIKNVTMELNIIERDQSEFYGNEVIAYLAGSNNNKITINDVNTCDGSTASYGKILISGAHGAYDRSPDPIPANNMNLDNNSKYPIEVGDDSTNAIIETSTGVTDNGTGTTILNDVYPSACCSSNFDASSLIEAEDYCEMSGVQVGVLGGVTSVACLNDSFFRFSNMDFGTGGLGFINVVVASNNLGGTIELRTDNPYSGTVLGTVEVINTGGWTTWETVSSSITEVTGEQDVYFVFKGGDSALFLIDSFQFSATALDVSEFETDSDYLKLFPNPVKEELHLKFITSVESNIKVYNSLGQLVVNRLNKSDSAIIDTSLLPSGLYFVEVLVEEGVIRKRIIKE